MLELSKLTKRYEAIGATEGPDVLGGVDLQVDAGASLAVVGPSGCGKSTLLNIIGTLDRPTTGTVRIEGADPFALNDTELAAFRNQRVGFVFQAHHLLPQLTVLENVLVPTLVAGAKLKIGGAKRALDLLKRVDLTHRMAHRPGQLSGGECQRVAVVRALINEPGLLLADEPTGSLDRASAEQLADLLVELNREQATTLIVVTHAADLAGRMQRRCELRDSLLHEIED